VEEDSRVGLSCERFAWVRQPRIHSNAACTTASILNNSASDSNRSDLVCVSCHLVGLADRHTHRRFSYNHVRSRFSHNHVRSRFSYNPVRSRFFIIQLPFMFVHNMFKYWRIWSHTSLWAQWDRREACLAFESMHPMSSCGVFERRRQNAETIHATFIDLLSSGVIGDTPGASFKRWITFSVRRSAAAIIKKPKQFRTRHVATGPWRLQTSLQ
jgi:hypothetical protein